MTRNYELNLEHERAEYALGCINSIKELPFDGKFKKDYASEVKQTRARLRTAGLLQTLAFYCSKMKDKERSEQKKHFVYLVTHLLGYILTTPSGEVSANNAWKLYRKLLEETKEPAQLMDYTQRARSITRWLMRFAATVLETKE
jgi:CRISPR type III-B/RAMP module-associated protein Cmr5